MMITTWFVGLGPMAQAFLATCFTWFVTALGAVPVFFFKKVNQRLLDGMMVLDVALG